MSSEYEASHFKLLGEALGRLEKHGFQLKQEKSRFLLLRVEYLGHQISSDGTRPLQTKVEAIVKSPIPGNIQILRSFLGLTNYYGKLFPNLSTLLQPPNALLQAGTKWSCSTKCEKALQEAKKQIIPAKVLMHYDPTLPIKLVANASAYGGSVVISHRMPDGTQRPIAFASHTLSASENNYTQLETEAFSLIYGVKKFY